MFAQAGSDPMPWSTIAVLSPLLGLAGLVIGWIGIAGGRGRLNRNHIVGIRTRRTLASEEAWEVAHRAGARHMIASGAVTIATAIALLFRPSNSAGQIIVGSGMALMLGFVIASVVAASRAMTRVET